MTEAGESDIATGTIHLSMAAGKWTIRVRLAGHSRLGLVSRFLLKVGRYNRLHAALHGSRLFIHQKRSALMTAGKMIQQPV